MPKWILVSPEMSAERKRPIYLWAIVCNKRGNPTGAGVTEDIREAATFNTKREALNSTALKLSNFDAVRVTSNDLKG